MAVRRSAVRNCSRIALYVGELMKNQSCSIVLGFTGCSSNFQAAASIHGMHSYKMSLASVGAKWDNFSTANLAKDPGHGSLHMMRSDKLN